MSHLGLLWGRRPDAEMTNRDEFSKKVRLAVAARAQWRCSLTGCGKHTIGPSDEGPDAFASICAASPGGRRYDASMTPDERGGIDNAIWMCSDHAKLIDRDAVTFTAEQLRAMKREHEVACARAVRTGLGANLAAGLFAIGPHVICTGELTEINAASWTLRLGRSPDHRLYRRLRAAGCREQVRAQRRTWRRARG
jgi:hypothetical protein